MRIRAAGCFEQLVAHFFIALKNFESASIGDILIGATMSMGDTQLLPVDKPYGENSSGGALWANISGKGELPAYNGGSFSFDNSSSNESNNLRWIKISSNYLVCDRNMCHSCAYSAICQLGGVSDTAAQNKIFVIDGRKFRVCLFSRAQWNTLVSVVGLPTADNGMLDDIIHWQNCASVSSQKEFGIHEHYGGDSAYNHTINVQYGDSYNYWTIGFRPVLELIE